jgi:hypothetical protein
MRASAIALVCAGALAQAAPTEKATMLKVTGTIFALRTEDVSKRAGAPNFYSYVTVTVDAVDPPEAREKLRAQVELIKPGKLDLAVGARVEAAFAWDALSAAEGRFRVQSIVKR